MTERGLPVNGAPACPFVAFADDRDQRAASPDHRHRCYADVQPAPRALAHQEAYCLSSAFPVCPTFQDWAIREAARPSDEPARRTEDEEAAAGIASLAAGTGRNPPRDWAAPPPWLGTEGAGPGGLSGSMADRLAAGEPIRPDADRSAVDSIPAYLPPARPAEPHTAEPRSTESRRPPMARPAHPAAGLEAPIEGSAPSWERPRRVEQYPTLRSRMSLPSISAPPLLLGLVALVLAAAALFFLPGLLGIGGPGQPDGSGSPGPAASASAGPTASVGPTPTPGPSRTVYIVQPGDTLSEIAQKFSLTLEALRAANPQITDPDKIDIGDEIIIPAPVSSEIPDAGTPSAGASATP